MQPSMNNLLPAENPLKEISKAQEIRAPEDRGGQESFKKVLDDSHNEDNVQQNTAEQGGSEQSSQEFSGQQQEESKYSDSTVSQTENAVTNENPLEPEAIHQLAEEVLHLIQTPTQSMDSASKNLSAQQAGASLQWQQLAGQNAWGNNNSLAGFSNQTEIQSNLVGKAIQPTDLTNIAANVNKLVDEKLSSQQWLKNAGIEIKSSELVLGKDHQKNPFSFQLSSAFAAQNINPGIPSLDTTLSNGSSTHWVGAIKEPVGQNNWSNAVFERVGWIATQTIKSATLKLNPPELGPLDVRVKIQNDQANVIFHAQPGGAREAIEQALPKLKELLESQGLQLGDVDVSEGEKEGFASFVDEETIGNEENIAERAQEENSEAQEIAVSRHLLDGNGVVDYYA